MVAVPDSEKEHFLPAKDAAVLVGYTPDYVAKLAREKSVQAVRDGRQWLVDINSLKLFSLQAKKQKLLRQEQLREERLKEKIEKGKEAELAKVEVAVKSARTPALLETIAVSFSIALFVFIGHIALREGVTVAQMAAVTGDVFKNISASVFDGSVQDASSVQSSSVLLEKRNDHTASPNNLLDSKRGIVVFDDEVRDEAIEDVRASFSDEVRVEMGEGGEGVITPIFRSGEGSEQYKFLIVPVNEAAR